MSSRNGVDVASWQGTPGQWGASAGDIGWAAVKVTELGVDGSQYVNPDAAADWAYLAEWGKRRIAYLFAHPDSNVAETASFFTAQVRKLGLANDDMIAVDLEVTDGRNPAEVSAWTRDLLGYLEHDLARVPLVYTYKDFAWAGNCAELQKWPLWISAPSDPEGRPQVPAPWKTWAIHQYSTGGGIDRDLTAWATADAMAAALGYRAAVSVAPPSHAPKPKPKPVRKVVKKAASGTKHTVQKEPVVSSATAAAALSAAAALLAKHVGLHLTATQLHAIVTALPALAAIYSALKATPRSASLLYGAMSTIAAAAASFGLHLSPGSLAAFAPLITMAFGLISVRTSPTATVAPSATPAPAPGPALVVPAPAPVGAAPAPVAPAAPAETTVLNLPPAAPS